MINLDYPVFFFQLTPSSLYEQRRSLAFIKANLHAFVISIICVLFNVD